MENLQAAVNSALPSSYGYLTRQDFEAFTLPANRYPNFAAQIRGMNKMYNLPINSVPHLEPHLLCSSKLAAEEPSSRIENFLKTLQEELDEGQDIKANLVLLEARKRGHKNTTFGSSGHAALAKQEVDDFEVKCMTDLADWFGDMVVYIRSEALKFGIPLEEVLTAIMASNFSKLGADGNPIINANGKFEKGPGFKPPEQYIQHIIVGYKNNS